MSEFLEVKGDLFDPAWGFRAIAHGCNCMGVMGAGIAKQVANKWPSVLKIYKDECLRGNFTLGKYHGVAVDYFESGDLFVVFNLASQHLPGPNADIQALEESLHGALRDCAAIGIPVLGVPEIGCGIGGLEWDDVSAVMKSLVERTGVGVTVVHYVSKEIQ